MGYLGESTQHYRIIMLRVEFVYNFVFLSDNVRIFDMRGYKYVLKGK